jgi:translation initiation factor IF-1
MPHPAGFPGPPIGAIHLALAPWPARSNVSKEELVHLEGEVVLIAKGGNFRVKLDSGHQVLAKLAGKVRRHRIRVVLGDRVTVAVSPYDPTRGFIVYRQR